MRLNTQISLAGVAALLAGCVPNASCVATRSQQILTVAGVNPTYVETFCEDGIMIPGGFANDAVFKATGFIDNKEPLTIKMTKKGTEVHSITVSPSKNNIVVSPGNAKEASLDGFTLDSFVLLIRKNADKYTLYVLSPGEHGNAEVVFDARDAVDEIVMDGYVNEPHIYTRSIGDTKCKAATTTTAAATTTTTTTTTRPANPISIYVAEKVSGGVLVSRANNDAYESGWTPKLKFEAYSQTFPGAKEYCVGRYKDRDFIMPKHNCTGAGWSHAFSFFVLPHGGDGLQLLSVSASKTWPYRTVVDVGLPARDDTFASPMSIYSYNVETA